MVWGRFSGWLIVAWVDGTVQVARASGPFCSSVCGRWRFKIKNGSPTPLHLVPDVGALYCWGLFVDAPMGSQSPPGNSNEPSVAPHSAWNVRMMIFSSFTKLSNNYPGRRRMASGGNLLVAGRRAELCV